MQKQNDNDDTDTQKKQLDSEPQELLVKQFLRMARQRLLTCVIRDCGHSEVL